MFNTNILTKTILILILLAPPVMAKGKSVLMKGLESSIKYCATEYQYCTVADKVLPSLDGETDCFKRFEKCCDDKALDLGLVKVEVKGR
jgi:hypothetical protein